jgi:hypothetical protein
MTSARDRRVGRLRHRGRSIAGALVSAALLLSAIALASATSRTLDATSQPASQAAAIRSLEAPSTRNGSKLTFRISEGSSFASDSDDQITIIFSDRTWSGTAPPYPLFGDDILAEFSFSAVDVTSTRSLSFNRIVRDMSFLDARYIRVVNHGGEGWGGGTLLILLDGKRIIGPVKLEPVSGPARGMQNWNRKKWPARTYWERDLQLLRHDKAKE